MNKIYFHIFSYKMKSNFVEFTISVIKAFIVDLIKPLLAGGLVSFVYTCLRKLEKERNISTNHSYNNFTKIYENSFVAANNVLIPTNVTNFIVSSRSSHYFEAILTVTTTPDTFVSVYTLRGYYNSKWVLGCIYIGDNTDINFTIDTNTGQLKYTSTSLWSSYIFRWRITEFRTL